MLKRLSLGLILIFAYWSCARSSLRAELPTAVTDYAAPSDLMTGSASPDGKWIAAFAADGTLLLWNTKTWDRRELFSHYKVSLGADGIAFSPDSSRLFVGDANGLIQIFEVYSGTVVKKLHDRDGVDQFAFSGDGGRLATWNYKGITVWDINAAKELRLFPEKSRFTALTLNRDGSLLITGTEDSKIQIWKVENGQCIGEMELRTRDWVNFFALDEKRKLLLSAQGQDDIGVWDLATGKKQRDLKAHTDQVDWLKLLPEKQTLFSISDDGTLKVWNYVTGVMLSSWDVPPGFVTDKGEWLVSGDPEVKNQIQIRQIASRTLVKTLTYRSPHEK